MIRQFRIFLNQAKNSTSFKQRFNFSNMVNPYSALNHTLLKNIYIFKQEEGYCGYIIKDDETNSLVCVDPGRFDVAVEHVKIMESQLKCKLTHVLCTHNFHMNKDTHKFLTYNDGVKIVAGNQGENITFHNQIAYDIKPFNIGELAVCYLYTPGHSSDSFTIAITQCNENSTKLPIIFTGETLLISSIGDIQPNGHKQMLETIFKLKSFPNETLLFPSKDGQLEDLLFAKSLDPGNPVINLKIQLAKQAIEKKTHILPSSLLEEKNCNPYLRLHDNQILKNANARNPTDALKNLKSLQNTFYNSSK
ncbi:hydroxyacylglutathione hydrolase (macronuclear) [Tetrahymena thermophila SB210]|uniref:Hydroxyacylglutathione hydrolase n=1 Tax=Tetrahymena thermophila (strain SB210) TaxID=312017 RepID=Q24F45_TETTS|nr:hydroxyacylglutathione hydrolase [Tetrahymena thermophila SB210]EAS06397.2 hydroxyacylglutathione hydrolase [Tetrahymena thermophila SB210]|eukprot:XP_001026642.2 hydroxyacylglutathione hydrolase [Tetrahymena thermophila SB210]